MKHFNRNITTTTTTTIKLTIMLVLVHAPTQNMKTTYLLLLMCFIVQT